MRKTTAIFIFFLFIVKLLFSINTGQNVALIDSLSNVIKNTNTDSLKYVAYLRLSKEFQVSDIDTSIFFSQEALTIAKAMKDKNAEAEAYSNIGVLYYYTANYMGAIDYFKKAVDIYSKQNNKQRLSDLLNNIGIIYITLNKNEYALDYLHQTLKIKIELKDTFNIAMAKLNIGVVYLNLNKDSIALVYNKSAIPVFQKYLFTDDSMQAISGLAYAYNNIAQIYQKKDENDTALYFYNKTLKYLEKIEDLNNVILAYINIASTRLQQAKNAKGKERELLLQEVKSYVDKAIFDAKNIKDYNNLFLAYKTKAEYLFEIQDYKNAFLVHKLYSNLKDSIFNKQSMTQIEESEERYQNLLKQAQLERQKEVISSQKKLIKMGTAALMVVIVLIVIIIVYLRENRKKSKKIEEINKNLNDSIKIASLIQKNVLKGFKNSKNIFAGYFVFFKPKELVGGDFIFEKVIAEYSYIAVADCVGHGVPGAMVSMLSLNFINQITKSNNLNLTLGEKLTLLRDTQMTEFIKDKKHSAQIGMDISLIKFNKNNYELEYAGANLPIYIVSERDIDTEGKKIEKFNIENNPNSLYVLKPDRMPVGAYDIKGEFTSIKIQLSKQDKIYMFSDGFADQFGGDKNKKYKYSRFKKLILETAIFDTDKQKRLIVNEFYAWKKDNEQVDDVTILCIEI